MCGFVVQISKFPKFHSAQISKKIWHRGPDATGVYHNKINEWYIDALHRRLSIIDLNHHANQPFISKCGSHVLIYNGEIYNWKSLKIDLINYGSKFKTNSDTEVLLEGIRIFGQEFLSRVNGMFAFVYINVQEGQILAGRDRFGIKPLYIYEHDDQIVLSSEIRGVEAALGRRLQPDRSAFSEFFLNGFLYEPRTGVLGVAKVMPGSTIEIRLPERKIIYRRYHLNESKQPTWSDVLAQVKLEANADVPVGIFYSGGIDSSVIALAAKAEGIKCFFVDYGKGYEADLAVAEAFCREKKLQLESYKFPNSGNSVDTILASFQQCAIGNEELISDYTYISTASLAGIAREAGFKVMLSGMGADEMFGGYPRYTLARQWSLISRTKPISELVAKVATYFRPGDKRVHRFLEFVRSGDFVRGYTSLVGYFSEAEVAEMVGTSDDIRFFYERVNSHLSQFDTCSSLRRALFLDQTGYLAHNLTVADRASMSQSVELRVPFVSEAASRFANSLDDQNLIHGLDGKMPLRKFLHDEGVGHHFRRAKRGFNPPLDGMIKSLGQAKALEIFDSLNTYNFIEKNSVERIIIEHFKGKRNNTYRIWQLIYFAFWCDHRMNDRDFSM
ncbi:MAG: asparagine synthase (glutamine-hydrolyzing) [Sphingobium sp.]|nr:MAG: asparagine synthase (glutamine-hydrolyzing) [Sphingobium sp.]